ncbi:MAG: hypothetical protein L3J93_01350 [Thermoplasmata archaeon]|nr:hypothetical protein [Thermoplasmata archaeon]
MRTSAKKFDTLLKAAPSAEERIAWFGALLAKESGIDVEIVGESATAIYLSSRVYVSQDAAVVGSRGPIIGVLRRWSFQEVTGRSARTYWVKKGLGLVDLVGPRDSSGLAPRKVVTPHGTVFISAVEPLILRRLWRASREHSKGLFSQAVQLARDRDLDWEYLGTMAKYEGVAADLRRLRLALQG